MNIPLNRFDIISIVLLNIIIPLGSITQSDFIIYQNKKIVISFKNHGITQRNNYEFYKEGEEYNIGWRVFENGKVLIGTENFTSSTLKLKEYQNQYLKKAIEYNKQKHDIEYDEKKFKIIYEARNNKYYFYYYLSKTNSFRTISKPTNYNPQKKDSYNWMYVNSNNFLIEIKINGIIVLFKKMNVK